MTGLIVDLDCGAGGACIPPPEDSWHNGNGYYRKTNTDGRECSRARVRERRERQRTES